MCIIIIFKTVLGFIVLNKEPTDKLTNGQTDIFIILNKLSY